MQVILTVKEAKDRDLLSIIIDELGWDRYQVASTLTDDEELVLSEEQAKNVGLI